MARKLTLNCDLGEGFGPWKMGDDRNIMPLIDAANVACGGHAGDPGTMRACVDLAKRHRTEIPSYEWVGDGQHMCANLHAAQLRTHPKREV